MHILLVLLMSFATATRNRVYIFNWDAPPRRLSGPIETTIDVLDANATALHTRSDGTIVELRAKAQEPCLFVKRGAHPTPRDKWFTLVRTFISNHIISDHIISTPQFFPPLRF
eukprot:SAG11_NODE_6302_length_1342_cov_1.155270_3_plen_113_part_00